VLFTRGVVLRLRSLYIAIHTLSIALEGFGLSPSPRALSPASTSSAETLPVQYLARLRHFGLRLSPLFCLRTARAFARLLRLFPLGVVPTSPGAAMVFFWLRSGPFSAGAEARLPPRPGRNTLLYSFFAMFGSSNYLPRVLSQRRLLFCRKNSSPLPYLNLGYHPPSLHAAVGPMHTSFTLIHLLRPRPESIMGILPPVAGPFYLWWWFF